MNFKMVSGDLQVFPLLPVLQMLLASGRSGKLSLQHMRGGEMWFENGELIHAVSMGLEGEAALQLLSSVDGGTFTFEAYTEPVSQTIKLRQDIIMRRMLLNTDQWEKVQFHFPNWDKSLIFSHLWNESQLVDHTQYRVLALVDETRSIKEMLHQSGVLPLDFFNTLQHFKESRMIELTDVTV